MGVLKATITAVQSVKEEMWREFFYCDAMSDDTILLRGVKRIGKYSANTRKDDDVLTSGSILSVADGQCVLVVKQGKVVDFCREPGEHVFEDPDQKGIRGFLREVGERVAFGGGDVQPTVYRVYYMNTREITGLPFRTLEPVPFRVRDEKTGLDLDSALELRGRFSYRVADPVKLYKAVIGNVTGCFTREDLAAHLRASLLQGLQPALAELSGLGLRPSGIPERVPELCEALRERMNAGWCGEHGLELAGLALDSCVITDGELVQSAQEAAVLTDPAMAAATLTQAAAEAMQAAAAAGSRAVPPAAVPVPGDRRPWVCACGQRNDSPFCRGCGAGRP